MSIYRHEKIRRLPALAAMVVAGILGAAVYASPGPKSGGKKMAQAGVTKSAFGKLDDGTQVDLYTLTNAHGMAARIMTYGATLVSLTAPDRHGQMAGVVLG